VVPVKTPPAIVKKMSEDLAKAVADPEVQAKLRQNGLEPAYLSSEEMGALMKRDVARWREVATKINLVLD
jgi:tripartite-type tricarboxylate transporter receptor subunit TctC